MLIQVMYSDNRHDFVKGIMLDTLIESGKIAKFRRRSGWVTLGVDQVRKTRRNSTYLPPNEMRRL